MNQTQQRLQKVDNLMDASDRLWKAANWYTQKLNKLRRAWAEAEPDSAKAEARYRRLSRRWKEESERLMKHADELMAKSATLQPA